jgi:hypothetical protein
MNRRRRRWWFWAAMLLLACGRSHTVASDPEPITRAFGAKHHRLAVIFLPQFSGCSSCDQMLSAVISEWQAAPDAQMTVVTVIPDRPRPNDPWLPGTIVRLKPGEYERYVGGAPLPRVEIRSADGSLLMSRSVPNYGSQADLLTEEMLAARSFTAPVAIASRRQP